MERDAADLALSLANNKDGKLTIPEMYFALNISLKKRHEDSAHLQGQLTNITCRTNWSVIEFRPLSKECQKA